MVAIPTDALYSLVADPFNLRAVGQVFLAKGREPHRSLPLLVPEPTAAEDLAKEIPARFYVLARRFWPGPLTIIVPAAAKVPLKVTGNTGRLALRQSRSAVANGLLERLGQPLISHQRQHLGPAHLPQRHRGVRGHGRPGRPGLGRGLVRRPGLHHGGYHRPGLEDHPRGRGPGTRRRRVPGLSQIDELRFCH